jgi:hypothetical protein
MTTPTTTLGLITYSPTGTDASALFLDFRTNVAGTSPTTNMWLIDNWATNVNGSLVTLAANKPLYGVSATYISANYYEATVPAITAYTTNMVIGLTLDTTNNGVVTLNINGLGTKSLQKVDVNGALVNLDDNELMKGRFYCFVYNGSAFVWLGATSIDQISSSGSPKCLIMTSACGVLADSGVKVHPSGSKIDGNYIARSTGISTSSGCLILAISGSDVMSGTTGSVIKHNNSTVVTGSYSNATIVVDRYGHVTSASSGGGGGGTATGVRSQFTSASVVSGSLTVSHNLGLSAPYSLQVLITDNTNQVVIPSSINFYSGSFVCDLLFASPISGSWGVYYI